MNFKYLQLDSGRFAVFDNRTKVVQATFKTEELAIEHALFCQQVENENKRKQAALDLIFGEGHTL